MQTTENKVWELWATRTTKGTFVTQRRAVVIDEIIGNDDDVAIFIAQYKRMEPSAYVVPVVGRRAD